MKNCDYFKDLVLTDYTDGELDKKSVDALQDHLRSCSDCRAFLNELENNMAVLHRASNQPVPEELWGAIRQKIEEETPRTSPVSDFIEGLQRWFAYPRLVPVFASLVLMFLAGSVTFKTIQLRQAQDKEQGEYLVSLLGPTTSSSQGENGFGTPMEHYFL